MKEITIATVALQAFYDKKRNVENILQQLRLAVEQGADLVVFPEQILQGYLVDTQSFNVENIRWQFAEAEVVESGEGGSQIREALPTQGGYAVIGMTERHAQREEVLFNTWYCWGLKGKWAAIGRCINPAMKSRFITLVMISQFLTPKLAILAC